MGSSKQTTNSRESSNVNTHQRVNESSSYGQGQAGGSQTIFQPRTSDEQAILDRYQGLGNVQEDFIYKLMHGDTSPYTMSQGDQDLVNKSFDAAQQRLMLGGKDYADYLATTRGLNKSDTPVSQQAMERFGLGLADLESSRAQAALDYGLQGTQMRLMGAQALPAGYGAAMMPLFNERMAGGQNTYWGSGGGFNQGMSDVTGNQNSTSNSTSTTTSNPSIMSQIGQGLQLAAGIGMMGGGLMTGNPMMAMGGAGMLGGGGGGNPFLTGLGSINSGLGSMKTNGTFAGGLGSAQYGVTNPHMYSAPIGPTR